MKFKPTVEKNKYLIFEALKQSGLNMYSKEAIEKCKEKGVSRQELDDILMQYSKYKKVYDNSNDTSKKAQK